MKNIFFAYLCFSILPIRLLAQPKSGSGNTGGEQIAISQVNVVKNGDFNDGNTGFYSSYYYTSVNTTEGEYYVGKDASRWYPDHYACGDHTNGKGKMLLVNGSPEEDRVVWKTIAKIYPDRKYKFTFWITSISKPNPAILALVINGKQVSLFRSSGKPCIWETNTAVWAPDGSGSASIALINKNTARYGNDFALDDISFIETAETQTTPPCNEKASADFTYSISNCTQVNFKLKHGNVPALKAVKWNFGDGQNSNELIPSHRFKDSKSFKVTAIVTSKNGCNDTSVMNVVINTFKASPFEIDETEPGLIRFSSKNEHVRYSWNFGDNASEADKQTTLHRYKKSGEYNPLLIIKNEAGCIDSISQKIQIDLLSTSNKKLTSQQTSFSSTQISSLPSFSTRKRELAKSLIIQQDSIRVLLSDNGIVDGDSITLIYDGKIILTHHLLSAKAYEIKLPVSKDIQTHELIMYAENLGSIPPNTSLMIVYDGVKRHQVYIRASENSNAVVEFKRTL